ncbi:MAG: 1-(5-phosphoribosyl)-5-amino-4-imidazole-carboxylate carboxylase [Nitrospinae bacterium CG11_big_fil_rev_8_21_14_0_20_56_8]|nr:MAG: 1-(5-phosphoribosyl)-5-amino-4-imidazole-carboxylate carboxylase [Nitrospinae bacterium CG11_big_fil_rev_8_21_14_0_20_56_8]
MNSDRLKHLLQSLYDRKMQPAQVMEALKHLPYENLEFANIDHHRSLRSGVPEVIYCEGKSVKQLGSIIKQMCKAGSDVLATRMSQDVYLKLKKSVPRGAVYNELARTLVIQKPRKVKPLGQICVVSAGTSDIPVAEEAVVTAEVLGSRVEKIFDVGVAGIHRLLDKLEQLRRARVLIVVAGMDGALASVVGGLLDSPVIAVPTSIGYGASFGGIAPLLTMLNSCAAGIGTVNIDNGFGAGCLAHKINRMGEPPEEKR